LHDRFFLYTDVSHHYFTVFGVKNTVKKLTFSQVSFVSRKSHISIWKLSHERRFRRLFHFYSNVNHKDTFCLVKCSIHIFCCLECFYRAGIYGSPGENLFRSLMNPERTLFVGPLTLRLIRIDLERPLFQNAISRQPYFFKNRLINYQKSQLSTNAERQVLKSRVLVHCPTVCGNCFRVIRRLRLDRCL